jgi:hypothetical protein
MAGLVAFVRDAAVPHPQKYGTGLSGAGAKLTRCLPLLLPRPPPSISPISF